MPTSLLPQGSLSHSELLHDGVYIVAVASVPAPSGAAPFRARRGVHPDFVPGLGPPSVHFVFVHQVYFGKVPDSGEESLHVRVEHPVRSVLFRSVHGVDHALLEVCAVFPVVMESLLCELHHCFPLRVADCRGWLRSP